MKILRRRSQSEHPEESYWISFSDLMTALLFVFILAVMALMLQLTEQGKTLEAQQTQFSEQISTLQTAEIVRAEMLIEIQEELAAAGIEIHVTENQSVLSIPSALLGFEAASYEIDESYENVSLAIGQAISKAVQKDDRLAHLDTIFVEGHTDNVRHAGLEGTGNWGLSAFRAIALWSLWDEKLSADSRMDTMRNADEQPLFSVSGYGETRPVTEVQESEHELAANRRIDIRFTITRPTSDDLIDIEKSLQDAQP